MKLLLDVPLLILVIQFNSKAFAFYLQPYPADVVSQLPPLLFPGKVSTWNVSALGQKEAIKSVAKVLGTTPFVSDNLGPVSVLLVDHLQSAAALENMDATTKTKLGIQGAFSKHQVRHFQTDVKILKRRLHELFGSSATDAKKAHSAIPTIQICEKITEYFADEAFLFWEHKQIFFPYLISFATLYAMVATSAGNLVSYKKPSLKKDMALLQATVLKYYTPVKAERMSNIAITKTRVLRNKDALSGKLEDMENYCPKMQVLEHPPSSPFTSCVRGRSTDKSFWKETKALFLREKVQADRVPEWFQDTVTGQVFCGFEGCWTSLKEYYGNEVDSLTMSALKLLPFVQKLSQLPGIVKKSADCNTDAYGRLEHLDLPWSGKDKDVYGMFGCHNNYCWKWCTTSTWKYTTNDTSRNQVRCDNIEECCPEWKCIY